MDNQDIPFPRLREIVAFLEKNLGRTSVLAQRLEEPLKNAAGTDQNANVNKNVYVGVKSAENPVVMFGSSMEKDFLDTDIHPPLPEVGSTEPLEGTDADPKIRTLTLPNGIRLTFNQVLTLAGNFYGLVGDSICLPNDSSNTSARQFMLAFNDLAYKDPDVLQSQLDQLLAIMTIEKNSVDTVLGQGNPEIPTVLDETDNYTEPSEIYKRHGLWFTKQYDSILGGRWHRGAPSEYGKVLNLAKNNLDDYQPYCLEVWKTGHKLALAKAREAGQVYREAGKSQEGYALLEEAYGISAFSCHYLVQSFTAGHIRVPVKQLISARGDQNGYNLGYYHFQEDEMYGINVINKQNERWTCLGQTTFYDRANEVHRKKVVRAVHDSVLQIFAAFTDAKYAGDYSVVLNQVPEPDTRLLNNYPLFKVAGSWGKVKRRADVRDLSCDATVDTLDGWRGNNTLVNSSDRHNSVIN